MPSIQRPMRPVLVAAFTVAVLCSHAAVTTVGAQPPPAWPAGAAIVVGDREAVWLVDASGLRRLAPATHMPGGMVVGFPHPDGLLIRESVVSYSQGDRLSIARWDGGGTRLLVDPQSMPTADVPAGYRHARGIWTMSVGGGADVWFATSGLSDEEDMVGFLEEKPLDDLWRVATKGGPPVRVLAPGLGGEPVVAPDGSRVAVLRAAKRRYGPAWMQLIARWSRWFRPGWRCAGPGSIRIVDASTGRWQDVLEVPCVDEGDDASWSRPPNVVWSPDSRRLRVAVATTNGQAHDAGPVRLVDIDATTERVTSSRTVDCQASGVRWSPSGEWFMCPSPAPRTTCRIGKVAGTGTRQLPGCWLHSWSRDDAKLILGGKTVNDPVVVIDVSGTRQAQGSYDALGNCTWLTEDRLVCSSGQAGSTRLELRDLHGEARSIEGLLDVEWYTKVDSSVLP